MLIYHVIIQRFFDSSERTNPPKDKIIWIIPEHMPRFTTIDPQLACDTAFELFSKRKDEPDFHSIDILRGEMEVVHDQVAQKGEECPYTMLRIIPSGGGWFCHAIDKDFCISIDVAKLHAHAKSNKTDLMHH